MELLKTIVNGNGAWCSTVASECEAGFRIPGLEEMCRASEIFGDPLYPNPAEHVDILVVQERMRKPGDRDSAHLGEAETITIITKRRLVAAFVTDDKDAQRQAHAEGIPVYSTWHILKLAVAAKLLSVGEFMTAHATLTANNRGRPPCDSDVASILTWLSDQ